MDENMLWFKKSKTLNQIKFDHLMRWTNNIITSNGNDIFNRNEALLDLIKIIMRPIQAIHMRDAYLKEQHNVIDELLFSSSMLPPSCERMLNEEDKLPKEENIKYPIFLSKDIVLPTNWHPQSIVSLLGKIGTDDRHCGKFRQDRNHSTTLLLPMRISFVNSGNHSISQGIITGDGTIIPENVIRLNKLFDKLAFDGENWIFLETGEPMFSPRYPEFGWIWEIARHITEDQIT